MKELYKEIYKKIKEYDKIVIARHIGADPDALGSTMGLKELILNTFPEKKVSVIGVYSSVFKYMGRMDKLNENEIKDSLLIVCDTPNVERIDGVTNPRDFAYVIKIDHHPAIEKFEDLKWVDTSASSVCQMLIELSYETRLKMNKEAAEKLFMGLVSDTNRFLYDYCRLGFGNCRLDYKHLNHIGLQILFSFLILHIHQLVYWLVLYHCVF